MAKVQLILKNNIVVVLDDNELSRTSLKWLYEDLGATVYTTGHLEKGLSVLEGLVSNETPPDLIVADISLPGCYGLQPLQSFKDALKGKKVPIIVISRGFNKIAIKRMMLFGVVGYVEKPTLIDKLFEFSIGVLADRSKRSPVNIVSDKKSA